MPESASPSLSVQETSPVPPEPPCAEAPREDVAASGPQTLRLLREPDASAMGRLADAPVEIPWPGWKAVLRRVGTEMISDRASLVAAGCAFYATLALFPVITMLISIYGLAFDPVTVEPQLEALRGLLPPSAYDLIAARVHQLVTQPRQSLGLSLLLSTGVALWSSASGVKSILAALNLAYEEAETRSFLRYQFTAFAMTLAAILASATGIAVLVGLPAVLAFLGFTAYLKLLIRLASFGVLVVSVALALALLYRYGPARRRMPRWRWVTPGSVVATVLWVSASALFSYYVANYASYDAMYGPLGTVVGLMLWFWVSAYVVQLGAELNAELELQTARDSTAGPPRPLGRRGAYVAYHVAED